MPGISQEPMSSSEARAALLSGQEQLRAIAVQTMRVADDATASDEALRTQGRHLCAAVQEHLDFEQGIVAMALADVLGLEGVLLVQLEADRQRQRANAMSTLTALSAADASRTRVVASIRALAESVMLDLAREERYFMTADVDELTNDSPGG